MNLKSIGYLSKTLAVVSLLTPSVGLPISVGDIHLNSALNQTVNAEFKLNLAEGENPSDISVRLATPEKFEQAGIAWNQFVSNLQIQTTSQDNQSISIKVSSKEPLTTPSLNFVVEISSPQGTQFKPFSAQTIAVINPTQPTLPVITETTSEAVKPVKKVAGFNPESLNADGTEYGPIKASDTLWSIAAHFAKQRGLTTKQMLTALQKSNPDAFNNGSIDSMKPGAVLQIPSTETAEAQESKPTQPSAPPIKNKALELAAPTETSISDKAEVGSQAKSDASQQPTNNQPAVIANSATAGNNEFLALQTKIATLEQQLSMMQKLLALKDQQLAILQAANKNQFAQANPATSKPKSAQPSSWLITSLGLGLLTGLSWLLWRKNQQDQQRQRDAESIFADDGLPQAIATTNNHLSFEQQAFAEQSSLNKNDFDFNLEFFAAPVASKSSEVNDSDWADDETKIDLAKAYIDMGDLEMAKNIAEEIIKHGNQQQKALAQALLAEL